MRLVIVAGPGAGGTIEVPESGLSVGREQGNDLVLADDLVSRRHLRLMPSAGGLVVEDLGSSNGTYVGGLRVATPVLAPAGGIIQVGSTILRVEGAAPTSVPSAALGAPTVVDAPPAGAWVTTPAQSPPPVSGPPSLPPPPVWDPNGPSFPAPPPSRRPTALVVIAAVAVLVLGLVGAGVVFFAGGDEPSDAGGTTGAAPTTPVPTSAAPSPSPSEAPSSEPTEAPTAEPTPPRTAPPSQEPTIEAGALTDPQQELLIHVPDTFRDTCSNPGYKHEGASAAVGCEPESGADYAQYNQYDTSETMEQKYKFWTAGFDYGPTINDCTDDGFGRYTYSYTNGSEGGSITCYVNEGAAWIEWTENDLVIYSFAERDDGDFEALFQWWLDESGPY